MSLEALEHFTWGMSFSFKLRNKNVLNKMGFEQHVEIRSEELSLHFLNSYKDYKLLSYE